MPLDPNTVNAINSLLGLLVACIMGAFWFRDGRKQIASHWFYAATAFELGHVSYLLRPWVSFATTTILGAAATSVALLLLLFGMERLRGMERSLKIGALFFAAHMGTLGLCLTFECSTEFRMVLNSAFWGGITASAFWCLRRGAKGKWRSWYGFPSGVIGAHALFHLVRLTVAGGISLGFWDMPLSILQSISFSETSLFTVALFMSLLVSDLRLRNRELQSALDEVQMLSGMLPICSGCKKIRDDAGYWTKLETFISSRSRAQFSHGLCPECAVSLYPEVFSTDTPEQIQHLCYKSKQRDDSQSVG